MRKKIILFSVSMAVAAGGFGTWCALTGVSPFSWNANPRTNTHLPLMSGPDSTGLNYEQRKENGDLEYLLSAPRATPDPDHKGTLILDHPQATFYMSDGRVAVVTADSGTVAVDLSGDMSGRNPNDASGKAFFRGGSLSKNVLMTMGPKETFASGSHELQPGQLRATFEDDIKFNNAAHSLVSQGPIHVRSDMVWFDGANLTMTFNSDEKRADYLRIDPMADGGKIIIKQASSLTGQSNPAEDHSKSTASTAPAPAPAATPAATAASPAVASTSSAPKATVYKVDFLDNVKAVIGPQNIAADQMSVIFQLGASEVIAPHPIPRNAAAPERAPIPAATPAAPLVQTGALPIMLALPELPADPAPIASPAPAVLPIITPLNVHDSDIVLTWSGPMEMRPVQGPSPLLNSKDQIFIATSQGDHAVVIHDGTLRSIRAGKVSLQKANQHIILEPGNLPEVEVSDAGMGSVTCRGVDFLRATGALILQGPGHANVLNNPLNVNAETNPAKAAGPASVKTPWLIQWTKAVDVTLLNRPDPKNPNKDNYVLRHAVLTGDAQVADPTFTMRGQLIDLLLTTTANTKQSLEHLMATGNVHLQGSKPAAVPGGQPETYVIETQRLDVQPPPNQIGRPEPTELIAFADGDVRATLAQADKTDPNKVIHQSIATPKLMAKLQPKGQATTGAANSDALGSLSITEVQATQGVHIDLEGYGSQTVVATADSLLADPKSGQAHLFAPAGDVDKSHFPRLQQGDNEISGQTIILDQKSQSMEIPGPGQFTFQQNAPKAGEAASPVRVTWANHMTYSGKDLVASLTGPVEAVLLGKPEQQSRLTSHAMQVTLAPDKTAGPNSTKNKLAQITAEGDVQAEGASFDPAGKLLTRIFIRGPKLIYDDASKTLTVPAAGQLEAEDNRPEAASTKPAKADNSPLAVAGGSKGQTAFAWKDSLTYSGSTGEIHLKKDVRMAHVPNKPAAAATPANPAPRSGRVDLECQDLLATLITSKTPAASPVGLGLGGESKVSKVTAQGAAQVKSDNDILLADTLMYDVVNNKAVAIGKDGNAATALRVDGPGFGSADRIEWDLGKGESGITLIHPRAVITTPDAK